MIKGIDVSLYDVKLNWSLYNWDFAFIKVSEGTVPDPLFSYHWNGARGRTFRSPYHYFHPFVDPKTSAQKVVDLLGDDRGEFPLMFDMENTDGRSDTLARAKSWLSWYEQFTGTRPIIYSSEGFLVDNHANLNPWLLNYKLHLAQYRYDNLSVDTRTRVLHGILDGSIPYTYPQPISPFKMIPFVQWTAKGAPSDVPGYYTGVGSKLAVDFNFYHGTMEQFKDEFGIHAIATTPFDGGQEYIEIVNNEKCHITVIDMNNKQFRVKHFNGNLGYVSQVAKDDNALVVFNGEDYAKDAPIKYYPKGLAYTDGVKYTDQSEFQYWMNVSQDNTVSADFKNPPTFWNATSFIRPLVIDGKVAQDIVDNPTKLEYTEIHACSALGFRQDGKIIQVVAEGKVDPNTGIAYRGITVPQLANLLVSYGVWFAGQHGGGGDSGKAINGVMVNEPSDPTERPVVQVIEILGKEIVMPKYEAVAINDGTRVRPTHNTNNTYLNSYPKGTKFHGDNLFEAQQDLYLAGASSPYQRKGDIWLQVNDINGVVVVNESWVSITNLGTQICSLTDLQPSTVTLKHTILVNTDGSLDIDGVHIP